MRNAGIQHRRLNLADGYPVTPFACHCYALLADRATRPQAAILTARTIWPSLRCMLPGRRASYLPGGGAQPRLSRADVRPAASRGVSVSAVRLGSARRRWPAPQRPARCCQGLPWNRAIASPGPDPRKTAPTAITKFRSGGGPGHRADRTEGEHRHQRRPGRRHQARYLSASSGPPIRLVDRQDGEGDHAGDLAQERGRRSRGRDFRWPPPGTDQEGARIEPPCR